MPDFYDTFNEGLKTYLPLAVRMDELKKRREAALSSPQTLIAKAKLDEINKASLVNQNIETAIANLKPNLNIDARAGLVEDTGPSIQQIQQIRNQLDPNSQQTYNLNKLISGVETKEKELDLREKLAADKLKSAEWLAMLKVANRVGRRGRGDVAPEKEDKKALRQRYTDVEKGLNKLASSKMKPENYTDNEWQWLQQAAQKHRLSLPKYANDPEMMRWFEDWLVDPYNEQLSSPSYWQNDEQEPQKPKGGTSKGYSFINGQLVPNK